jgi:hypothetical protein
MHDRSADDREYLLHRRPIRFLQGASLNSLEIEGFNERFGDSFQMVRGWRPSPGGEYDSFDNTEYRWAESSQVFGISLGECHSWREYLPGFLRIDS